MALVFLSFQELPKDEQPPRSIWLNGEKLTLWFEEVERKREEKYKGTSIADKPIDGPVSRNDASDPFFKR